ncbi:MAG TPA: ABC transporter ATP-binding protein [Pyrinomonadaceae bacterium]|jgi:putative ABC transport system ATP-binding protein
MLLVRGLSKTYESGGNAFTALKNINLKIDAGDCVAIIGKSGSGKSTLMHLLACLDAPSSGEIVFEGKNVAAYTERQKDRFRNEKFGFVFQQFFLNGRDTVLENVTLPLKIRGVSGLESRVKGLRVLDLVGLADKAENRAKDLSGGEKQRVCIARALVGEPKVLFADEPTGNLDSANSEAIENLLFDLNRKQGVAVVIVTHDTDLADKCSRVIELRDGEIVAEKISVVEREVINEYV